MQQFKVSRQRIILGGSKSAKSIVLNSILFWGGAPKFEANPKK